MRCSNTGCRDMRGASSRAGDLRLGWPKNCRTAPLSRPERSAFLHPSITCVDHGSLMNGAKLARHATMSPWLPTLRLATLADAVIGTLAGARPTRCRPAPGARARPASTSCRRPTMASAALRTSACARRPAGAPWAAACTRLCCARAFTQTWTAASLAALLWHEQVQGTGDDQAVAIVMQLSCSRVRSLGKVALRIQRRSRAGTA